MVFFPRFVAHEVAPTFRGGESNLFRLLDDYASLIDRSSSACSPAFAKPVRTFQPRFDVKETKDAYELHGEFPGFSQKDINIEFTDATTISIRGRNETVREEGRHPAAAAVESQPEQEKPADADETESTSSSNNYHKASVEDEFTVVDAADTTTETPAASEAPAAQSQEIPEKQQDDAPNYWFSERSVGSFARSFQFPQRVDQEAVKASLKDGILSIVVPKAAVPANRTINIE